MRWLLALLLLTASASAQPASHRIVATLNPVAGYGINSSPLTIPATAVGGLIRISGGKITTAATAQSGLLTWPANMQTITVTLSTPAVDANYGVGVTPITSGFSSTGVYSPTQATPTFTLSNTVTPTTTARMFWWMLAR